MPRSSERLIATPLGPARAVISTAGRAAAELTLVLGHGASGGIQARDLLALAAALPSSGVRVIRVEQPWKVAGRRIAGQPAVLDRAWSAVIEVLAAEGVLRGALVVGGRSAGARVACRTALTVGAAACVALAFPLHPPGRPERSRLGELLGAGVPTLVVQGERDPFGTPEQFPPDVDLVAVPHADHAFRVPRSGPAAADQTLAVVVESVTSWLAQHVRESFSGGGG